MSNESVETYKRAVIPAEYQIRKTPDELLNEAKEAIAFLSERQDFVLSELYRGVFWNRLAKDLRLMFGMYFKSQIEALGIEEVGRASKQIVYRKKI